MHRAYLLFIVFRTSPTSFLLIIRRLASQLFGRGSVYLPENSLCEMS